MFGACCCVESQDGNELKYTAFPAATDETLPLGTKNPPAVRSEEAKMVTPLTLPPQGGAPAGPSSQRSLSPEEKEKEKARLQELVNRFAKKAVRGCPCVYVKEGSAERFSTQYRIDKSLEYLILVNAKDPGVAEVTCPIAAIQDIYSMLEDGESCFPSDIVGSLRPEERELLLMVVFSNSEGKLFRFCLLEDDTASRDIFLECLRILCIYAQSGANSR
eukprot:TRINITY_DN72642_c0_g1_i1.p1 TRINITY_DN72642_c0_g1~~TRINITY_DN72642_c0_g1_i1.p1  ORF type:complete len:252 (+),score=43.04 TRINITY_DN72642_c0_g1_i1:103-756(+)